MSSDDDQWGQDIEISQTNTAPDAPFQNGFQGGIPLPSPASPPPHIPDPPSWNPPPPPMQSQFQQIQTPPRVQTSNWPNTNQPSNQPFIPRNTVQPIKPPAPKSTNDWGQPQNRNYVQPNKDFQKTEQKELPSKVQDNYTVRNSNMTAYPAKPKNDPPPFQQDFNQNKQKYDKYIAVQAPVPPPAPPPKPQIQQPVKAVPKFTTPADVRPSTKNQFMANCPKEFVEVIEKSVDSKGNFVAYSPDDCVKPEYRDLFAVCGVLESCKPPAWWVHCDDLHVEIANYDLTNYGPQLNEPFDNED